MLRKGERARSRALLGSALLLSCLPRGLAVWFVWARDRVLAQLESLSPPSLPTAMGNIALATVLTWRLMSGAAERQ